MDFRQGRNGSSLLILLSAMALVLSACGSNLSANDNTGGDAVQSQESNYCVDRFSYSGGVAVTGGAFYEYRQVSTDTGLQGNPLRTGIPYAELVVKNSGGTVIQCGETSDTGAISLTLPAGAGSYSISVLSRSNTDKVKVSVLEDYYVNRPYAITKTFTVAAGATAKDVGWLIAAARVSESAKIEGGAFNILAQIYKANEFLRTESGNASFVAPKVSVYWRMGFNPYNYYGVKNRLLSFYRPGASELFILGGDNGDVKSADTDHFDNSVILHEYGHFLEDHFAKSESPGGQHTGDGILDPRLAWSEGWANFFQAAVLRSGDPNWKHYIDTVGFRGDTLEGGSGYVNIKVDLGISGKNSGLCYASAASSICDRVGTDGEGTFREMAISRFLFKSIRAVTGTAGQGAGLTFGNIWSAFSGTDSGGNAVGLGSSRVSFRNIGLFNSFLASLVPPGSLTDWNNVREDEKQNADSRDYGAKVNRVPASTCAVSLAMSPTVDIDGDSNQFTSNDFFRFDYDGTANQTLSLAYSNGNSNRNLNLYLYKEDYVYQETGGAATGGIALASARPFAIDQGVENISLSGLAPGRYLINVKADTYGKSNDALIGSPAYPAMGYSLKLVTDATTEDLCPAY